MMMMKPFEQEDSSSSSPSYGPLEVIYRQQGDDDSEAEFAVGEEDREQGNAAAAAIDDSTSSSSKTQPQKERQQQQQDNGRLFVLLSCLSACLMPLLLLYVAYRNGSLLSAPFGVLDRDDDNVDDDDVWAMALATATLPVPFSALSAAAVREGSLALSQTGRTLVVGLPESMMEKQTNAREPGRVVVLQQQQQAKEKNEEGTENDVRMTYQTSQTILAPATDAYSGFGTAVALSSSSASSSSTTLVIGMPRNVELSQQLDGPHVQTYVNNHNDDDDEKTWKLQSEFPQLAPQDASGSWVAVSNDASYILYAAPNYHNNNSSASSHEDEAIASPGAVRLLHHGQPQALWMGDCNYGSFGQTVALSSSSPSGDGGDVSVAVVTSGGCPTATTNQMTVHVYDLIQTKWLRTLVVDEPPDGSCTLGGTGTAATVSQDGRRIVVLAACLDQATLRSRQVIYTFESATNEQGYALTTWRQQHKSTLIVDCELLQYRMSTFAASHDAKTLVLTGCRSSGEYDEDEDAKNANSEQQRGGGSRSSIVLLQWDDDRAEWRRPGLPQRKSGSVRRNHRQHDIVGAQRVALSGDGRVLAVLLSDDNDNDKSGKLVVYQLPPRLAM